MTKKNNETKMLREEDLDQVTGGASLSRGDMTETAAYDPQFRGGVHVAAGDVNGDGSGEYLNITFSDVIVSSYQSSGSSGG